MVYCRIQSRRLAAAARDRLERLRRTEPPLLPVNIAMLALALTVVSPWGWVAVIAAVVFLVLYHTGRPGWLIASLCCISLAAANFHSLQSVCHENYAFFQSRKTISGRVVDYSRNSFIISTEHGRYRVYLTNYQMFLRDLGVALRAAPPEFKPEGFSPSELALAEAYAAIVPYREITVRAYQSSGEGSRSPPGFPGALPGCAGDLVVSASKQDNAVSFPGLMAAFNRTILERLFTNLKPGYAAVIFGMLTGISAYIPDGISEAFSRTGTFHLLAVSGLHVGLVYLVLKKTAEQLRLKCVLNSILAVAGCFFYVCLSGFQVSAVRALLMIGIYEISQLMMLGLTLKDVFHLVLFLFALLRPEDLFGLSFKLSFGCIFAIAYVFGYVRDLLAQLRLPGRVIDYLALTLSINLTLIPLNLIYFKKTPFAGMLANVVAVPLALPLLVFTLVVVLSPVRTIIAKMLEVCLLFLIGTVKFFALLPLAAVSLTELLLLTITGGAGFMVLRKAEASRMLKLLPVLLVPLIFMNLRTYFVCFDVGEGASCLVRTPFHASLLDTGPPRSSVGAKLVLRRCAAIDEIIISHFHLDHAGNLLRLARDPVFDLDEIYFPVPANSREKTMVELVSFLRPGTRCQVVKKEREIKFYSGRIELIKPSSDSGKAGDEGNEDCIAAAVYFSRGKSILYPADMPAGLLVKLWGRNQFDVIVAPHHGSIDGFSPQLYYPEPERVIIPCGKNSYGHPSPVLIEFLKRKGIKFEITQQHGDVEYFP